jgi:predicted DNA-binding transcriptional regulator AlpA
VSLNSAWDVLWKEATEETARLREERAEVKAIRAALTGAAPPKPKPVERPARLAITPRLLKREDAAAYVNVSPNTFDKMVTDGVMPKPKHLTGKRQAWDVRDLDAFADDLPTVGGSEPDKSWD